MVSLGDTVISFHILQPPLTVVKFLWGREGESQNPKCQDLPKFQFSGGGWVGGGGGVSWKVKTQSAKIYLNFNFFGGRDVMDSQNPKCQDLPKFQFSGGGRGSGRLMYVETNNPWGSFTLKET